MFNRYDTYATLPQLEKLIRQNTESVNSLTTALEEAKAKITELEERLAEEPSLVDISGSVSASTGILEGAWAVIKGNVITVTFAVKNASAVAAGSNIFRGTLDAEYCPLVVVCGTGHYGSSNGDVEITAEGIVTVRCIAAQLSANNVMYVSATYLIGGAE